MKWDAWSLVFTGLSLTCVTSAVLFLLVAMNPKDASYGTTPLIYAGGSEPWRLPSIGRRHGPRDTCRSKCIATTQQSEPA